MVKTKEALNKIHLSGASRWIYLRTNCKKNVTSSGHKQGYRTPVVENRHHAPWVVIWVSKQTNRRSSVRIQASLGVPWDQAQPSHLRSKVRPKPVSLGRTERERTNYRTKKSYRMHLRTMRASEFKRLTTSSKLHVTFCLLVVCRRKIRDRSLWVRLPIATDRVPYTNSIMKLGEYNAW